MLARLISLPHLLLLETRKTCIVGLSRLLPAPLETGGSCMEPSELARPATRTTAGAGGGSTWPDTGYLVALGALVAWALLFVAVLLLAILLYRALHKRNPSKRMVDYICPGDAGDGDGDGESSQASESASALYVVPDEAANEDPTQAQAQAQPLMGPFFRSLPAGVYAISRTGPDSPVS